MAEGWGDWFDTALLAVVVLVSMALLLWVVGLLWRLGAWLEKPRPDDDEDYPGGR